MGYGYIKKDELMHYGVKGMKWRKHLKSNIENKIGLTDRRAWEATGQMRYDSMMNDYKYGHIQPSARTESLRRQQDVRKAKYDRTPLGRVEKTLNKLDRGDDRVSNAIDNALSKKKKTQKQLDKAAAKRIKDRDKLIEKNKKNSEKKLKRRKTKIPGVYEYGYVIKSKS
ncbi:MAG: hypothetical protein J6U54_05530 [Clostridiales bacterium]|nr:hypothetical protein [Clostridiales bacterium]